MMILLLALLIWIAAWAGNVWLTRRESAWPWVRYAAR